MKYGIPIMIARGTTIASAAKPNAKTIGRVNMKKQHRNMHMQLQSQRLHPEYSLKQYEHSANGTKNTKAIGPRTIIAKRINIRLKWSQINLSKVVAGLAF
jgi:hypothetical protein